ncbi:MAG TPA: DMT family transporter [Candidatus Acidoferrales bacterium]|nr:DMT family transporter [Candidatus Acidoferrales bacterium]
MTSLALALVLTAAVLHATWNLLAKRASAGSPFIWLTFAISTSLYAPVAIAVWLLWPQKFTAIDLAFIIGNGALHMFYFIVLQRGYRLGDLSLVYPLARGTGPLLSSIAAIIFLGERPTPVASAGIIIIVLGVFLASGLHRLQDAKARASVFYGLATGLSIAAYTLWDKHSMAVLALNPILYDWGGNAVRFVLMTPVAVRRWGDVRAAYRDHRLEAVGIAVLSPLAYLLVLWALTWAPVTFVAPARELSIMFGTFFGIVFFKERDRAHQRLIAAALMLVGIVALAHG